MLPSLITVLLLLLLLLPEFPPLQVQQYLIYRLHRS
jgi:hypothetical protein